MPIESASIKAIKLTRTVLESVHGNLGVLKFNIDELTPINGTDKEESKKWKVICSFFESLSDSSPSKYEVMVNLNDNIVSIKKLGVPEVKEQKYRVLRQEESKKPNEESPK